MGDIMDSGNPNTSSENYLREKVSKLQGILSAFNERKQYIKTYINRCEVKQIKLDKLNKW